MRQSEIIEKAADAADERSEWRRKEDRQRTATLIAMAALLVAGGLTVGRMESKVGRTEFANHVLTDSIDRVRLWEAVVQFGHKQDSTNARLSRLACKGVCP